MIACKCATSHQGDSSVSTHATRSGRASASILAVVTSFLVVLSGLFVAPFAAPAAFAADGPAPAITVSPTENLDPTVENTLTVSGTGFLGAGAAQGAYVVVGDKTIWSGSGPLVASGWIKMGWVMPHQIVNGAFTTTLTLPAHSLDPSKSYHVATSAAHELSGTDRTMDTFAALTVAQPAPVAQATTTTLTAPAGPVVEGAAVTLTATVTPAAEGTVSFDAGGSALGTSSVAADGVAMFTTAALTAGTQQITASFTPADAGAFTPSASAPASVTVTAPQVSGPAETTLAVSTHASSVSAGHLVGLTAKLTSSVPNTAPAALQIGTIQFFENGVELGKPITASLAKTNGSSATVTTVSRAVVAGQDSVFTATFTPTEANTHQPATSAQATVTGTAATGPWNAQITLFVKVGESLTPYTGQKLYKGDEIVVRGTGFDPEASVGGRGAPLPIGPQGAYVVFGNFDSTGWKPSDSKPSTTRKVSGNNQGWVLSQTVFDTIPEMHKPTVLAQWVQPAADGSFEWTTTLETPALAANGKFGIYTYAAGGAVNANEELEVLVNYVDEVRPSAPGNPNLQVFLVDGTTPYVNQELEEGDRLVVRGTGFDPYANKPASSTGGVPIPNSLPQGTFLVFGSFAENWQPSQGASSAARAHDKASRAWLLAADTLDQIPNGAAPNNFRDQIREQWVELDPATGSFETTITLHTPDAQVPNGKFGIYSYAGGTGQVVNAAQELSVELNYQAKGTPDPEPELTVGGLDWAFNTGWNSYAKFVARATITGTSGATVNASGLANYTQVAGGNYDAAAGVGSIHYEGIVRYVSELHGFDIAIKNPQLTFTSRTTATMTAELSTSDTGGVTNMTRVTMATLTPGASTGAAGSVQTWANVPGVFAQSIQPEGWADYAGGATAPFTIAFGANQEVDPEIPTHAIGDLDWAFSTGWNSYAKNFAKATITASNGATVDANGNANYTQVKGGNFDAKTGVGSIHYQGIVRYVSELHGFDIAIKNPQITFTAPTTATLTAEVSDSDIDGVSKMTRITLAQLTAGAFTEGAEGLLNWADVQGVFADPIQPKGWERYAGTKTAPLNFTFGAEKSEIPVDPVLPPTKPVVPTPAPKPVGPSQQAGSLSWGISSAFKNYVVGPISKGAISTSGVGSSGGAYVFPQANGGSWNKNTQTGTVQFSGVVTFSGHKGLMTETFANPVITVTSATSGTIVAGGRTFGLNLGAASKSVGANGEVTWSGVPVSGSISGGGSAGGEAGSGSFSPDSLSFTVGAASGVTYGSTTQTDQKAAREAAATPPATTGITVVTPEGEIVPGGEIEFSAEGFEASERDILVVLYSDPIVLDRKAGANADGKVTWIGKLPADLEPGTHTITLQGSKNAGAVITVVDPAATVAAADVLASSNGEQGPAVAAAGLNTGPVWLWWIGAGALVLIAGATGGLVMVQRSRATRS